MTNIRTFLTSGLAAFALTVAAPSITPPAQAQVIDIATDTSPVGLDPHVATSFATFLIVSNIYEGLTAIDSDLRVAPSLSDRWAISSDGLTYDFHLRAGAVFHNGRPLTAQDVIANLERVRDAKTASPLASRLAAIKSMETSGDDALHITLSAPSAPFLAQLAGIAIAAPEAFAEIGRRPVGTGPYLFKDWAPDTFITLARNPKYWDAGLPHLDGLKFDIVPDAATRQVGLQGGTYKLIPVADAATAAALKGKPGVKLLETQDLAYSLIGVNTTRPPFDKPAVREAMNMALDRAQIVQAVYFGRGVPGGPLSPALAAWALPVSEYSCYKPDPAAAAKKLAEAGIVGKLKITLNVLGSIQQVVDIAQVVQAQLNKAGFDVTLNVQEQGKFIADWRASNFDGFVSLNGGNPDPDDYFGRTFQTGGATNVFKYSDATLDALLAKGRTEVDPAKRKVIYDQVQKQLACQGPVMHIAYGTVFSAVRDDLHGFAPMPTRSLRTLRDASVGK
jgi:peptide/nickel transport system substrate-binding protein